MLKFKSKKDREMFTMLHPVLIMIYADLFWYAKSKHGIELVVTDTISTEYRDKKLGRVSSSHRDKRALDIRTKDLSAFVVNDLLDYINNKPEYDQYKYVSNSGQRRLAYYHVGSAEHLHLAIHKKFAL